MARFRYKIDKNGTSAELHMVRKWYPSLNRTQAQYNYNK